MALTISTLVSERFDENLQEDQNTHRVGMRPFKVEMEVRQRLVRRSGNCGKSILKVTQSNLAIGCQMSKTRQDRCQGMSLKRKKTQDKCGL
ncbi:hypothetical protein F2Q69_00007447 [Brassica cretica]|uniref:Uncharacterized protein n=1 Tax=Brassica cretica TaxID=69181 RepID=A0A8S9P6E8_BRACR|nr:hypothetical protein F2Q69_00007447 [Brassica cretica]